MSFLFFGNNPTLRAESMGLNSKTKGKHPITVGLKIFLNHQAAIVFKVDTQTLKFIAVHQKAESLWGNTRQETLGVSFKNLSTKAEEFTSHG